MRILEMLLIFNNLILVGLSLRKVNLKKFTVNIFNCTGFALLVSHYIIEGFRWQMYPVYLATAFYLIFFVCQFIIKKTTKNTYVSNKRIGKLLESRILNIVIILFLLLSILTTYILPVKFVNKPDGSYAVGTFSLFVEDRDRPEYYTSDPDDYRKFVIQFWYPADITEKNNIALWLPDGNAVTHGLARMVDFPSFTMEHMALIESNSFYNAPVSDKQDEYPVVIISHGWQGFRNIHTDIAELLASNGYIVISINHTFGAV
ncbi:MAG: hypothetical protein ACOC2J_04455, partial [bacterium]